jgi:hypothetical protein
MTKLEKKEMRIKVAKKMEIGHMMGRIYLSEEGLERIMKMQNKKEVSV